MSRVPYEIVIRAKLREYTPWWSGDYARRCLKNESPYLTPLNEETLKGRLRWVLRALLAGLPRYRHLTIEQLDKIIGLIFGFAGEGPKHDTSSLVRIVVEYGSNYIRDNRECVERIYNEINHVRNALISLIRQQLGQYAASFDEFAFLSELFDALGKWLLCARNSNCSSAFQHSFDRFFIAVVSNVGTRFFPKLSLHQRKRARDRLTSILRQPYVRNILLQLGNRARNNDCLKALANLVATPYIKLNLLGVKSIDDFVAKLPSIRECGCRAEFKVELHVDVLQLALRQGFRMKNLEIGWQLASLALAALGISAMLVGLGRGSTRGFSRFTLSDVSVCIRKLPSIESDECNTISVDERMKDVINAIKKAGMSMEQGDAREFVNVIRKLIDIAQQQLEALLGSISVEDTGRQENIYVEAFYKTSVLDDEYGDVEELHKGPFALKIVDELKHPLPVHIQVAGSKDYQCMIASNPSNWKVPVQDIYEALSALSTSTLKIVWKLHCGMQSRSMGGTLHTQILGLPRKQVIRGQLLGYTGIERRKSPIIMMPLCGKETCKAVIGAFITISDHTNALYRLLHSSSHYSVKIIEILQNALLIPIQASCCSQQPSNHPGGISIPCTKTILNVCTRFQCNSSQQTTCNCPWVDVSCKEVADMVLCLYDAALTFISSLLS